MCKTETYKTLLRAIKEKCESKDIPYSWNRGFSLFKKSVLLSLIYRFKLLTIKISAVCFLEIDKPVQRFLWKCKGPRIAKML